MLYFEQYDAIQGAKFRAAVSEMFVATRDENGEIPTLTQFAQQSMGPHIAAMESLMSRMGKAPERLYQRIALPMSERQTTQESTRFGGFFHALERGLAQGFLFPMPKGGKGRDMPETSMVDPIEEKAMADTVGIIFPTLC